MLTADDPLHDLLTRLARDRMGVRGHDDAFRVFTERLDEIKPRDHNLLEADIETTVLEPRAGGRIYDRGVDGSECEWATVILFEPPDRFVFSWNLSPSWQLEPDHLEQVHADMAEVWQPLAARFVALAAGELVPAVGPGDRPALPLLGR